MSFLYFVLASSIIQLGIMKDKHWQKSARDIVDLIEKFLIQFLPSVNHTNCQTNDNLTHENYKKFHPMKGKINK